MKEFKLNQELKNYLYIFVASIIIALGIVGFFSPNKIITGGTAGLALLLHYITPFTIGTLIIAVNLPLILIGWKYLGKMFAIRTIITILLISLAIDFFDKVLNLKSFVLEMPLASIFGGIFIGVGLHL